MRREKGQCRLISIAGGLIDNLIKCKYVRNHIKLSMSKGGGKGLAGQTKV